MINTSEAAKRGVQANLFLKKRLYSPGTQYSRIFSECFLSVAMFGTSREHLGNILKETIFY